MKAVYAAGTDYDNPLSQLKVGELDTPETKPFWSTIHVAAASVNHHDIWSLQGVGLSAEQTPMILGTDASGVLDEDIPVRKGLKAGAEVVLYTFVGTDGAGVMPGEWRTILSEKYAGTMAETTQVPSANVFAKPANLTLDEAAALGTSWLTAYSLLFTSANVKPGDTVLVQRRNLHSLISWPKTGEYAHQNRKQHGHDKQPPWNHGDSVHVVTAHNRFAYVFHTESTKRQQIDAQRPQGGNQTGDKSTDQTDGTCFT